MQRVDEQHNVTPVDTKWIDTDKAIAREPMQTRSRIVTREFKSGDKPDLYAGTPPLEDLKAIFAIAASRQGSEAVAGEVASRRPIRKG